MNPKIRAIGVCALVVVLAVGSWILFQPRGEQGDDARSTDSGQARRGDEGSADAEYVMIGGVQRKRSEIEPARRAAEPKAAKGELKSRGPLDYGVLPAIPVDANPQVAAVAEAIREQKHPERISVMATPPRFDLASYRSDPAAYLSMVELGRVFQTAQPGPGVPRLQAISPGFRTVTQGESVWLQVSAPPDVPVSFTSFDCGEFDNRLTAITVAADEEGVAEARFTTTPGTINDIHVLAGGPLTSGQVRFVVNVAMPLAKSDVGSGVPRIGNP